MDITVPFAARVVEAVRSVAAEEVLPRYRTVVAQRKDDGSLVTEADHAAQDALIARLAAIEPAAVIAEEMERAEQLAAFARGGRCWCIDPLDGTRNFSQGVPYFAISVALLEEGRPVFGVVHDPIADEAFYAVRGAGAWLGAKPLRVPPSAPMLAEALAEVSLRSGAVPNLRSALKRHAPFRRRIASGASSLSWCHLAAARADVLLHSGQMMWDYAAGALVCVEAGGAASTLTHDDFWLAPPWERSAVAARHPALLDEWREWIRKASEPPLNADERR